jgi:alpha-glucosidase/lysosomal alpha-glucosidase
MNRFAYIIFIIVFLGYLVFADRCVVNPTERSDCGYHGINEDSCTAKGCCWKPETAKVDIPWCFYKRKQCDGYIASNFIETPTTLTAELNIANKECSLFSKSVERLKLFLHFETESRIHVKVTDIDGKRWELPESIIPYPKIDHNLMYKTNIRNQSAYEGSSYKVSKETDEYVVTVFSNPFGFYILRKADDAVIFDTTSNPFVFENQYLEFSTAVPLNANLYGLGEVVQSFRLNPENYKITLFSRDAPCPENENIYGSHPFYLEMRKGKAHGVFLKNSNAMDIILKRETVTYKIIGGVIDLYFFMGTKPEDVTQQYMQVIGKPHMIPYWALGFHQCRYGYKNIDEVEQVVDKYKEYGIPLETMWTDIDYMDGYRDFTFDPVHFPVPKVRAFIQKLHKNGQKYVLIVDPGIKIDKGLPSYDRGISQDIFMKNADGSLFVGNVWPGYVHFPDFFHPLTQQFWVSMF